jgi:hypothetical protein
VPSPQVSKPKPRSQLNHAFLFTSSSTEPAPESGHCSMQSACLKDARIESDHLLSPRRRARELGRWRREAGSTCGFKFNSIRTWCAARPLGQFDCGKDNA